VAEVFLEPVLDELVGTLAVGQTGRSADGLPYPNIQPFTLRLDNGQVAVVYNGNFTNATDAEAILHLIARSREPTLPAAVREALLRIQGAYSLVTLTRDQMIVARDPRGFHPLAIGSLSYNGSDSLVFASETCALDAIGAHYKSDVEPGEMVIMSAGGMTRERFASKKPFSHCVFEHVNRSSPDSVVFGRSVQRSREMLGCRLARESPADADVVVPISDCAADAAKGYASESVTPYHDALIRNQYVGRTLVEDYNVMSDFTVKLQLNPVRSLIEGKRVILVEESIVSGDATREVVRMVRKVGAREVHLRIACPPTISPCFYGVDIPDKKHLIASTRSVEEIRNSIEADSLAYLSTEGLRQGVDDTTGRFCYACSVGKYPTALITHAEEPPTQEPLAETELLALAVFGNQLVSINPDGEYAFLDEARSLHKLLWVFSSQTKALQAALEEFESLINDPRVREADLQDFFERNPDFIINDEYKKAHPHVVLESENAEPLIPDFVLEPINQDGLCDLLELKHPLAKISVMKPRRNRFSAEVFEACAQLREYSLYFDDQKNRETIYRNYGLRSFRPRLFLIIGRRGSASPIELRKAELDMPHLYLQTYDDVLHRMKARITAMKEGRLR
jgi:amidophosphoribosyltransferase